MAKVKYALDKKPALVATEDLVPLKTLNEEKDRSRQVALEEVKRGLLDLIDFGWETEDSLRRAFQVLNEVKAGPLDPSDGTQAKSTAS